MNGYSWTRRLLFMATATVALAGTVVLVPAAAFASPVEHAKAISSLSCRYAAH
ncbi:hypothetical protein [Streptomyces sp. ISL-94]|uniref:hypothetical protein n=1 Tax=Streptomyces sp. ISL-94 TaxID=2819190 RepID=UPI001BEB4E39|nr:hypothetical protein [Streptomyces sp. ISL-94]MBT2480477.1 hypothetical protein [Streptomyces sp. ISL-94]